MGIGQIAGNILSINNILKDVRFSDYGCYPIVYCISSMIVDLMVGISFLFDILSKSLLFLLIILLSRI